jgi:hypothetical protein
MVAQVSINGVFRTVNVPVADPVRPSRAERISRLPECERARIKERAERQRVRGSAVVSSSWYVE